MKKSLFAIFFLPAMSFSGATLGCLLGLTFSAHFYEGYAARFVLSGGMGWFAGGGIALAFLVLVLLFSKDLEGKFLRRLCWSFSFFLFTFPVLSYFSFFSIMNESHGLIVTLTGNEGVFEEVFLRFVELLYLVFTSIGYGIFVSILGILGGIVCGVLGLVFGFQPGGRRKPTTSFKKNVFAGEPQQEALLSSQE